MFIWSLDFSRKVTNHLEIKMYYHGSFWKNPEFPGTFLFMPNRSSERVLELSRRIDKLVEHSRVDVLVLYLAYDIIAIS